MKLRRFLLILLATLCVGAIALPSMAQDSQPIVLLADAGFDNYFRTGQWIPIQIQVSNEGTSVSGRLVVRPETSGRSVSSAFSTPIDLPTGSDKTAFLYIQAQPAASTVLIELIDDEGVRITEQPVGLTAIDPRDSLHMVVSGTGASTIPLNNVVQGGYTARQARWEVDNIPTDVAALQAIDTLILYDVQSDELTIDQIKAITAWTAVGGHLIVIGGPSWAQTTSGFGADFLPFMPTSSQNIDDISSFSAYINDDTNLSTRTFITTGDVNEDATVLIETGDGLPLYIRREFGTGNVDFLTVDPTLEPLRSWSSLGDFWFTMLSNPTPEPGWQRGFLDLQDAARSLAILPNVELLPPVTSMMLFIIAYILLIGPINYFVLSRLGRRAWGWVTIPLFIVAFTLLAWNVGFNLRGNDVIVSRLFITQSFSETDLAFQDELVGVLSPRREIYDINVPVGNTLEILPGVEDDSLFSANVSRTTAEVSQGQNFAVNNIPIDGGIFANFAMSSVVTAPDISGSATIGYLPNLVSDDIRDFLPTAQSIRGFVRNDSDVTLEDVVIMTRNRFYRVEGNLEPGDVLDFDTDNFEYINEFFHLLFPIASPFQSVATYDIQDELTNRTRNNETLVTSRILINLDWATRTNPRDDVALFEFEDEEMSRRRAFLRSFMRDQYATGGIGNQVYVFGWSTEQRADDITISDVNYNAVDTSLYIIELESEIEPAPSSQEVTLGADQFTWAMTGLELGQVTGSLHDLVIVNPGWAEFQITPLEGAVLDTVTSMAVEVNRATSMGRQVDISLWNWETEAWDTFENSGAETYNVENPTPYLGRDNIVNMRVALDTNITSTTSTGRVLQLRVIQTGNF